MSYGWGQYTASKDAKTADRLVELEGIVALVLNCEGPRIVGSRNHNKYCGSTKFHVNSHEVCTIVYRMLEAEVDDTNIFDVDRWRPANR